MSKSVSLLTHFLDFLLQPQIHKFCLRSVLHLSGTDAQRGGKIALMALNDALESSLCNQDDSKLNTMLTQGLIAPQLHVALSSEIQRCREEDGERIKETISKDLLLPELTRQPDDHDDNVVEVELTNTRLIAGGQRKAWVDRPEMSDLYKTNIGSNLIILSEAPGDLWKIERQREIMLHRGCSVQFELEISAHGGECKPHTLMLEACIPGEILLDTIDNNRSERDDKNQPQIIIADLNNLTGGNYWESAIPADEWWNV